jgi:hypothetical protein
MSDLSRGYAAILTIIWCLQKLGERLTVYKLTLQKFVMERFSLKKLNEVGGKEQY